MQTSSSKTKNHFHSIKAILQDMMLYTKSKESFFYTIFFFFLPPVSLFLELRDMVTKMERIHMVGGSQIR